MVGNSLVKITSMAEAPEHANEENKILGLYAITIYLSKCLITRIPKIAF